MYAGKRHQQRRVGEHRIIGRLSAVKNHDAVHLSTALHTYLGANDHGVSRSWLSYIYYRVETGDVNNKIRISKKMLDVSLT